MVDIISNNIYKLRIEKNLTQEDLAGALGVTRQTIIAMEKGNYTPSVALALKVASFFNKPVFSKSINFILKPLAYPFETK